MAEVVRKRSRSLRGRVLLVVGMASVYSVLSVALVSLPEASAERQAGFGEVHTAVLTPVLAGPTPTITGIARVGSLLTAHTGAWSPSPITFSYQWKRNGVVISGGTLSTYRVVPADQGATLSVSVTSRRTGSQSVTKSSASTTQVTVGQFSPPTPSVYGNAMVGGGLGVNAGNWGLVGVSFSVQWNRNGIPIPGANAVFYIPRPLDRGRQLTATIVGSAPGYSAKSIESAPTAPIDFGQFTGTNPAVIGALTVGSVVIGLAGDWSPIPDSLHYQWFRDGNVIGGATSSDYRLQNEDAGAAITVDVTASKSGYRSTMRSSQYRKDWQWVTLTETYSAWDLYSSCVNFGDSYDACDPGMIFVPSDGVRLYSSGFGDVMNVATGIPLRGHPSRWRVTFNNVSKTGTSAFLYNATGINAADTSLWNALMVFPQREIRHEYFTTPWSSLIANGGAVFSIGSLDWSSLYFQSVTIEYDTVI